MSKDKIKNYRETEFDYEVKIYPVNKNVKKKTGILANASVTINESLVIGDIVIRESKKKDEDAYVLFPSRAYKDKDGETQYKNIVFPCTSEARQEIVEAILEAYEEAE